MMQKILITGGTGMIGTALCHYLLKTGYEITVLTRNPSREKDEPGVRYAAWDVKTGKIDVEAVKSADYIIHLAGAGVMDHRWSGYYKEEILASRTKSSSLLVHTLKNVSHNVKAIISSSAIGWYGADKHTGHKFIEDDPASNDFLGQTCLLWEQSIEAAEKEGIKVCKLRTGIVLSNMGGALKEFEKPMHFGIGGILGNGKQIISWIHIDDLCRIFHYCLMHMLSGSFNAVAPTPVTNKKLIMTLGTVYREKFFIPFHVPSTILKMLLGEKSVEILKSCTVSADKIMATGFRFLFPTVEDALTDLYKIKNR
ncbi:MAG: TIGR01777 family oxidoreductase [Ferruginibacter sp.]